MVNWNCFGPPTPDWTLKTPSAAPGALVVKISMAEAFEISGDTLHSWPWGGTQFIIPGLSHIMIYDQVFQP